MSQKEVAVDACVVERSCRKASTTDPFYTGECSAVACPANSAGTEASTAEMAGGRVWTFPWRTRGVVVGGSVRVRVCAVWLLFSELVDVRFVS